MANINGIEVKKEIADTRPKGADGRALLAGFVRSCMSLVVSNGGVKLQLDCQSDFVRDYIAGLMLGMFGVAPSAKDPLEYPDCEKLLRLLGIVDPSGDGFAVSGVPELSEQAESAYIRGVFLGCGSFSARDSDGTDGQRGGGGYHLEFSVLSESFADEIAELLRRRGIAVHKMERAEKYVVYAKDIESVCNCLALMRLYKLVIRLNDTAVALSIKRDVNRRMNCDIANMTRIANASVDILNAIQYIAEHAGLDSLPPKLVEAADARLNSPEASLGAIAFELGISKSGLKHRYDKIAEIAERMRSGLTTGNKEQV